MSKKERMMSSLTQDIKPLPQFAAPIPDKYKCVSCQAPLRGSVQTPCGHRICYLCKDKLPKSHQPIMCPAGEPDCMQITRDKVVPDFGTNKEMDGFSVLCKYEQFGCKATMPWKDLDAHVANCKFAREKCSNEGCSQILPNKEIQRHIETDCEYTVRRCMHCRKPIQRKSIMAHVQEQCPEVSTPCSYNCGDRTVLRREMEQHKQTCPSRPVQCPCRPAGCNFTGTQRELDKHWAQEMEQHLKIVMEMMNIKMATDKVRQEEVHRKLNELESNQEQHQGQLQTLQKTLDHQDRRLGDVETHSISTLLSINDDSGQESVLGARLIELDLRVQILESGKHEGILMWRIEDYRKHKRNAITGGSLSLYSKPFFTGPHGYKMCCCLYLNGRWRGLGTHLSLFLVVMKGENDDSLPWPFKQKVTFSLLDAADRRKHHTDSFNPDPNSPSCQQPKTENVMNVGFGLPLFATHSLVESDQYLRDDAIFIKVEVEPKNARPPPDPLNT